MRENLRRLLVVFSVILLWGGCFGASLAVASLDLGHYSALCGEWGCLPPTAPLISVHGMWLTLIVGGAWLCRIAVPYLNSAGLWLGLCLAGATATLCLLGWDGYAYLSAGGNWTDSGRRALYRLITWTDLPLAQITFACFINWFAAGMAKSRHARLAQGAHASQAAEIEIEAPTTVRSSQAAESHLSGIESTRPAI